MHTLTYFVNPLAEQTYIVCHSQVVGKLHEHLLLMHYHMKWCPILH